MCNITLVIFISMIAVSCTDREQPAKVPETLSEKEVKDFINDYGEIWAKRDTVLMKEAMSDNYIYFSSNGGTINRSSILGWFTPEDKYQVNSATRNEIKIIIEGTTAIVSSHWVGNGSFAGEKFEDDQRCSLVIKKQNGKLKIISEHCTQITM